MSENYLQKYNQKNVPIPVRIPSTILNDIPIPKATFMRNAVIERLNSKQSISELKKSLIFLFNFFEKNSRNLDISDSEREELKKIYEGLR